MENILHLFSINSTMFTVWDYQMSYIEFFGTIFTVWCVWLTARAKVLSWPIGIVGVTLFMFLFYQIQLYSDMFEQVFFLITGFIGWWVWLHPKTKDEANKNAELKITTNTLKQNLAYAGIIIAGTAVLSVVVSNLDNWLPMYFPEPASFPILDAFTTVMSFMAQWLLVRKKVENWVLWIIIDIIAVGLYWVKGVKFVSIEYALFFFIASYGLISWIKVFRNKEQNESTQAQV